MRQYISNQKNTALHKKLKKFTPKILYNVVAFMPKICDNCIFSPLPFRINLKTNTKKFMQYFKLLRFTAIFFIVVVVFCVDELVLQYGSACEHMPGTNEYKIFFRYPGQGCRYTSTNSYTSGTMSARIRTAARANGTVTAMYLLTEKRGHRFIPGTHEEIDFEFLGRTPTKVWINIFQRGKQKPRNVEMGFNTSDAFHTYTATWNATSVTWWVDGKVRRRVTNAVFDKPMYMFISVTGNTRWTGQVDWSKVDHLVFAEFEILKTPENFTISQSASVSGD
eukprot:TRINITY_DN20269_c0_g1_i1.p1 TRINITY_DN20269_c0_g1~~TRINITY_DN20269_c0_g1_i1.p1  ORF type:complete len:279 (-),score=20.47 TRINITY_DN20269_c0_g1_i1:206-1042(-)